MMTTDTQPYILFLDDDQITLQLLENLYADSPHNAVFTDSPLVALETLKQGTFKVVVSDQVMPQMTGIQFFARIKNEFPDIIRILLTGYEDLQVTQQAINIAEVFRFVNKPIDGILFKKIIAQAVNHHEMSKNVQLLELIRERNVQLEDLNQTLSDLYKKQKEFSSTVSHELKTPLSSIYTAVDILLRGTAGALTEKQKEFLDVAKENVDRLQTLITDILTITKLEEGSSQFKFSSQDINHLIHQIVVSQQLQAGSKVLYLKEDLDYRIPPVDIDAGGIARVLLNLIGNAYKYTEKGGVCVTSRYHEQDHNLTVCVEDTGIGIKEEDFDKLFKKYQQLGNPAKDQAEGLGLGLSLCKEIIKQHGGNIWVESGFGKGSRFCFSLPVLEKGRGG